MAREHVQLILFCAAACAQQYMHCEVDEEQFYNWYCCHQPCCPATHHLATHGARSSPGASRNAAQPPFSPMGFESRPLEELSSTGVAGGGVAGGADEGLGLGAAGEATCSSLFPS